MNRYFDVRVVQVDAELAFKVGTAYPLLVASPAGSGKVILTLEGEKGALQSPIMSQGAASRKWLTLCPLHEISSQDLRGFTR